MSCAGKTAAPKVSSLESQVTSRRERERERGGGGGRSLDQSCEVVHVHSSCIMCMHLHLHLHVLGGCIHHNPAYIIRSPAAP